MDLLFISTSLPIISSTCILEKGLLEIQYDLPEYRDGKVSEITVTEKTLKGEKPMLTYEFDAKEIKEGNKEDNGTTGK